MATIKYFGAIVELTQCREEQMDINNMSVSELMNLLYKKYDLKPLNARLALNQHLVDIDCETKLNNEDMLALLPPFAGG